MTHEFIRFCEKNRIIPWFLPPHSSHAMQPLDVGVFNVYKHYHAEAVEAATMAGHERLTKDDFLAAIDTIRGQTFKDSTVKLGWRLTGLWPINPEVILQDLPNYGDAQPDSDWSWESATRSQSTQISTPKTADRIKKLEERIQQSEIQSERCNLYIQKLAKAARTFAYQAGEVARELEMTSRASSIRHARYSNSRAHMRITGLVTSSQVQYMKRIEKVGTEVEALNKLRPKWKKVMVELKRHCRVTGRRIK